MFFKKKYEEKMQIFEINGCGFQNIEIVSIQYEYEGNHNMSGIFINPFIF